MLTIDQIRSRLKDRRLKHIADSTGLHVNTVSNVRDGVGDHKYSVLQKLSEYLEIPAEKTAQ